jgi:hypothetical protein
MEPEPVKPNGADLCRMTGDMVQRQPDTFSPSLRSSSRVIHQSRTRAGWDMRIISYEAAHWNGPAHGDQTSP